MILPIYIYGNGVLRGECALVEKDQAGLNELIDNMFETMRAADGIGLSANQVGFPIRMFVCDLTDFDDTLGDNVPSGDRYRRVFINPEIIEYSGEEEPYCEGCLSLPGINENVIRPTVVTIRYRDENWVEHTHTFDQMWARVIQHEYDHVCGKVFADRLVPIRRTMLKSKLAALTKGNFKAKYRCKL